MRGSRLAMLLIALATLASCSEHERRPFTLGSACNADFQCDDAHACNGLERCLAGTCALGETPDCDDGDPCTADGCTEGTGCVHVQACAPDAEVEPDSDGGLGDDASAPDAMTVEPEPDAGRAPAPLDPATAPEVVCDNIVALIEVDEQRELAAFDGVECVAGDLTVHAADSLSPLRNLRYVGGDAYFAGIKTRDVGALSELVRVDGSLSFLAGPELYWLHSLDSLEWVGASLIVDSAYAEGSGQPALNVLTGPPRLRNVGGSLSMKVGYLIEGFDRLERIGGLLSLTTAQELSGFGALTSIEGDLHITDTALTRLSGFGALTHVAGRLHIVDNGALRDLEGLRALEHVGGEVVIEGNPVLEEAPAALSHYSIFTARLNPRLSRCALEMIAARAAARGVVAAPELCCNLGCETCVAGTCAVSGTVLAGQSTHYPGEIARFDEPLLGVLATTTRVHSLQLSGAWATAGTVLPLETVDAGLQLYRYQSGDLRAFGRLREVGTLSIVDSPVLDSLDGLEALESIGGGLAISGNAVLSDLSALDPERDGALETLHSVYIAQNERLSVCEAGTVAALVEAPTESTVIVQSVACEGSCAGAVCQP